jgi:predicted enzyme related to lactoylglutathione lyase
MGGLFFRAKDPKALSAWYRDMLGVGAGCTTEGAGEANEFYWATQGGPLVFAPFAADSDYFAADKAFMINLRVSGLDAILDHLRGHGVEIITKPEWEETEIGSFARIHDPEGNAVELWEPPAER